MGKSEFKVACRSVLNKSQKLALAKKVRNYAFQHHEASFRLFLAQVREDYRVHMIMDNLPAATKMIADMPDGSKKDMYDRGFRSVGIPCHRPILTPNAGPPQFIFLTLKYRPYAHIDSASPARKISLVRKPASRT